MKDQEFRILFLRNRDHGAVDGFGVGELQHFGAFVERTAGGFDVVNQQYCLSGYERAVGAFENTEDVAASSVPRQCVLPLCFIEFDKQGPYVDLQPFADGTRQSFSLIMSAKVFLLICLRNKRDDVERNGRKIIGHARRNRMREKDDAVFGFAELPEPDALTRDAAIEKRRSDGSVKIGVTFAPAIVLRQTAGKAAFSADDGRIPAAVPTNLRRIGDQPSAQRTAIRVNDSPCAIQFPPFLFHSLTTCFVSQGLVAVFIITAKKVECKS